MTAFAISANEAFDDYDGLVAAINDWLDRADLDGVAGQMIALAEDEMRLELEPLFLEASTSLTTNESGFATLPSDTKRVKRVYYDGCVVPQRSVTAVENMPTDVSRPWSYTIEKGSIRIWPAAAHTVSVLYTTLLPRLTQANPSNNLLDLFPSLYFYGSMVFAHGYVVDDKRAARFRSMFDMQLAKVKRFYQDQREGGPMVARVPFVP